MANHPKRTSIPTAIVSHSKQNLSGRHLTTQNFMELGVGKFVDLVPNQSVTINHRFFTRLQPMPVPTMGDCYMHSRWFFVPYRTVMPAWNDFIEDTPHVIPGSSTGSQLLVSSTPYIPSSQIREFLKVNSELVSGEDARENADLKIINSNGYVDCYNLTAKGRRALKILQSLGYGIDLNSKNTQFNSSALNLLCLAKIYMDWYYPTAYINDLQAGYVEALFNKDGSQPYGLTVSDLGHIFDVIDRVCYDSDYFTSAWDNPVSPTTGTYSNVSIKDVTVDGQTTINSNSSTADGTPTVNGTLTQFADDALHALTDYLRRHQITGARVIDRYLSRFGITLDSAILNRSLYLGSRTQSIDFGNVTSTSDTEGSPLGSYAGIGVGNMEDSIKFSSDEYGLLLCVTSIVPGQSYYQGCDRSTLHLSKFDFWTPEFDNLGVQALATSEVYMPLDARHQYRASQQGQSQFTEGFDYGSLVFGFVPRYAEYKRGSDFMTGDFRLRSRNADKGAWTLMRDVKSYFDVQGLAATKHSADFVEGLDSDQYDRIFYYPRTVEDTFNVLHLFKIDSSFPGKSLYDSYEYQDEDKAKKVSVDVNGVKAN